MKANLVANAVNAYAEESGDDAEAMAEGIIEFLRKLAEEKIDGGDLLVVNSLIEALDEVLEDLQEG